MDPAPLVIASLNTKGGVGKTSTCFHLTAPLVQQGNSVLLVDMDYQGNLSRGCIGAQLVDSLDHSQTTTALFDDSLDPTPEHLVFRTSAHEQVSLIPAHRELRNFAFPCPQTMGDYVFSLRDFLQELHGHFDVILIDCHPSLDLLAWNALVAAEFVLCPFQAEDYGAQGISLIQEEIDRIVEGPNRRLKLLGYVLNMVRRCSLHSMFETLLREQYGGDVFATSIPQAIQMPEAIAHRQPVGKYKPRSKAAKTMKSLAEEILERVPLARQAPPRYLYHGNRTMTDMSVSTPEDELRKAS